MKRLSTRLASQPKVVVVGGGVGGLCVACLLAKDGYQVTVLEKNEQMGGRASRLQVDGFSFDLGPSWYMMPEVFDRFFAQFDKQTAQYLSLERLDPQYRIFFDDGSHVDISPDIKQTIALFESIEAGAGHKLQEYLQQAQVKYRIAIDHVLYKNIDSPLDMLSWDFITQATRLDALSSMATYVAKFFTSPKLQQIIQYTLVFLGGSPQNTPALYSLMSHVDFNDGVWYPRGGFYSVVEALVKLGTEQGVRYVCQAEVQCMRTQAGKVTEVEAGGVTYQADYVVANADYAHAESLLDTQKARTISSQEWQKKTYAPSAFLLFLGYKGKISQFRHHTLYFGKNWMQHFDDIFSTRPSWPLSPSLYINMPSATDPTVAPKGHENLMVLVPIASGLSESEEWRQAYSQFILSYIHTHMGMNIENKLIYKKIFSVTDFATRYNAFRGNALGGLTHTLRQSLFLRPPNYNKHLRNLFYVGAGTQPGIGVPICMISAQLVRQRLQSLASN